MLILFIRFAVIQTCSAQTIHWEKTANWQLYNLHSSKAFTISIDSLRRLGSVKMSSDTMNFFSKQFQLWPPSEKAVWMGLYVLTFDDINGVSKKLVISNYGGFLYDPVSRNYYAVPRTMRERWYDWLNEKSRILIAESVK